MLPRKFRIRKVGMVFPIPKPGDRTTRIPLKEALMRVDPKKERFYKEIEEL